MDLGKEAAPYVIEPLVEPVPGREPSPAPVEPDYAPEPVKAPEREREPVPA
jgi:hypothetical protein